MHWVFFIGIAMPTCISINNCVCHFSPLRSDAPVIIKDGQMVKIDLGAHIDGYIATAAHTVVVGASMVCLQLKFSTYCDSGFVYCFIFSGESFRQLKYAENF